MRRAALTLWLTVLWIVLWGDPTVGNVIGGLIAAAVVLAVFPARRPASDRHTVRPVALARLVGRFAWQLVASNVAVAREALTPRDGIRAGILAVPVRGASPLITTIVANATTLTPGTLTLEVRDDPPTLYVHVLHLYDADRVRADMLTLEALVIRAIGSPAAVRRLADPRPAVARAGAASGPPAEESP